VKPSTQRGARKPKKKPHLTLGNLGKDEAAPHEETIEHRCTEYTKLSLERAGADPVKPTTKIEQRQGDLCKS
jgi:hypothetical protein